MHTYLHTCIHTYIELAWLNWFSIVVSPGGQRPLVDGGGVQQIAWTRWSTNASIKSFGHHSRHFAGQWLL